MESSLKNVFSWPTELICLKKIQLYYYSMIDLIMIITIIVIVMIIISNSNWTEWSTIHSDNRTEWNPIRSVIIRVSNKIGRPRGGTLICLITGMITEWIGRHKVLLPMNHNHYYFRDNKCTSFFVKSFLKYLSMIGKCNCPISGIRLQPTIRFHCPISTPHNIEK